MRAPLAEGMMWIHCMSCGANLGVILTPRREGLETPKCVKCGHTYHCETKWDEHHKKWHTRMTHYQEDKPSVTLQDPIKNKKTGGHNDG